MRGWRGIRTGGGRDHPGRGGCKAGAVLVENGTSEKQDNTYNWKNPKHLLLIHGGREEYRSKPTGAEYEEAIDQFRANNVRGP